MPELTLILIRGLPGSGKSTLAQQLMVEEKKRGAKWFHYEADMFFINSAGEYQFNPKLLSKAHQWCQKQCELTLQNKQSVIISNTFVKQWELEPYRILAKQYKAKLDIRVCSGKYQSIHDVPQASILKMKKSWQT